MLGSSWDVSWHFRWLRDDLAPPHLLNSAGTAVVIGLVVFHSYTGYGVDRRALRLMQWGIGMFLIAVPIDILNHRINGLDITSWSPSHGLLYLGTAIMLAGAIRGWWLYAAPGRIRDLVSLGLWLFFVENVLFPNQHQEYGVLSLRDYLDGHTTAEPQLLDFAAAQGQTPTMFMLPGALLGAPGLADLRRPAGARRRPQGRRPALDGDDHRRRLPGLPRGHVAASWSAMGFPPSVLPFVLLVGAVLVDLAVTFRVPGWAGRPGRRRRRLRRRPSARRRSACCPRGTGGRCCRSPSASACSGPASTCSTAAAGWPAGRPPTSPRRRWPCPPDPRRTGAERRGRRAPDDVASEAGAGAGSPARGARGPRRQAAGRRDDPRSRSPGGHTTCWP